MLENKRIMFAAGGTGGHINPALAVAGYIRENYNGTEILFVGSSDKMETRLVPEAGFNIKTIKISGFRRSFSLPAIKHNLKTLWYLFRSSSSVKKIIRDFNPDVVIGFGGYVSGPVLRMAAKMGIPTAIHEQNAFPGVTNKALAGKVDRVMLTTGDAEKYMKCRNPVTITGLPIRGEILRGNREKAREALGIGDRFLILSMGGSLGAKPVNDAVMGLIERKYKSGGIVFLHATGKGGNRSFSEKLAADGVDASDNDCVRIEEYIDIPACMPAADLIIGRSGASSLSEIQALGVPSILIPSPYVAENHQYHNAMALVNRDAAMILEEKNLTVDSLCDMVDSIMADREKLRLIGENAKKMALTDAAKTIAETVSSITK